TYWPPLFTLGLRLAAVASAGLVLWWTLPGVAVRLKRKREHQRLQRETSLGSQPEEDLADTVSIPGAGAPLLGGHVVAAVEQLGEAHAAELGDSEEGGGLHLDG